MKWYISPYILAIALSWIIAQGIKYVIAIVKDRKLHHLRQLYLSGNMPSAHSATVVSMATIIGLTQGLDSSIFGLSALFASVVMYDAMMVRRSSGEQGIAVRKLIQETHSTIRIPRAAKGHTPVEVLVGALLGLIIGAVVFLATK